MPQLYASKLSINGNDYLLRAKKFARLADFVKDKVIG